MLARLFRSGLILIAVFALVWTVTILWWQSINRMPTTGDIVTHLFLLPTGMIAAYLVIRRALDGIRGNVAAAASAPAAAAAEGGGGTGAAPVDDDPSRHWRALLLGAASHTAYGPDVAATAAAAIEQQRPGVVDLLRDGAPIFAAPVEDLDIDGTRAALERDYPALPWTDEAVRATALALDVGERMIAAALLRYPALDDAAAARNDAEPLRLVITLLLPQRWQPSMATAAGQLLRGRLASLWPIDRISIEPVIAKADGDAMLLIDRAIVALHREPAHPLRAVIAADSHIGTGAIDRLRAANRLFGAQCEHGLVPSEAAAGILLHAAQGPLATAIRQNEAPASITRASIGELDAPTPDKGKPRIETLDHAVAQALTLLSSDSAAQPVAVTSDISPHPVRTVEVARVFSERFGELDLSADLLPVGTPCGDTGNAGALLAVVLAHHQCIERAGPALALSAADARQRGAIAVLPPVLPPVLPAAS